MPNPEPYRTAPLPEINGLRARYKLAPLPDGVEKIAGLMEGREKATLQEIAKIIDADCVMTQKLIVAAFPRPAARDGATVQMATARLGIDRVIMMMVGDLLTQSVLDTFETMVSIPLLVDDGSMLPPASGGQLMASVKFTGRANGEVTLAFSPYLGVLIAARLLGGNIEDKYPPETVNDAVGEIVNIITGNLQSRLSDAGLPSEVALPEVKLQNVFPTVTILGGSSDRFYFRHSAYGLGVNLCIAPLAR